MDLQGILERINKRLDAVGKSATGASKEAGLSEDAIRNLRRAVATRKGAGTSTRTIAALAPVLRTTVAWLTDGVGLEEAMFASSVPIVGKGGAGPDGQVLFAHSDGEFGEATALPNATEDTRALIVEGTSLRGMADDGSLVFYDSPLPPSEAHIGELSVCWLEDDRVLIKYPYPGSKPGLWHLESTSAPTIRDVPVRMMALITGSITRAAAKSFIRRSPHFTFEDVKVG